MLYGSKRQNPLKTFAGEQRDARSSWSFVICRQLKKTFCETGEGAMEGAWRLEPP